MNSSESPRGLGNGIRELDSQGAADRLKALPDAVIAQTLADLGPGHAIDILGKFSAERRARIAAATLSGEGEQWLKDWHYPEGSVGRLMEISPAQFRPQTPVADVIEAMREIVRRQLVTYVFATETDGKLMGVVTFRELLYAAPGQRLAEVMVSDPFFLPAGKPPLSMQCAKWSRATIRVYPVCDSNGRLLGKVRGQVLFEQQAFEISAQAGSMVGVEKEERTSTPWQRALRFRHPWLQLNLLTAFIAASVVGLFQNTVNHIVLPGGFFAGAFGQCSNTGCQALAVTLRGMTLNELRSGIGGNLILKEAWLGFLNGVLVGCVAAVAMFGIAHFQQNPHAATLAAITLFAMALSSVASGVAGAAVPLGLKRMGADPAMASSIFLTTATDVVSMGLFLARRPGLFHDDMSELIDSHSHLDAGEFDGDRVQVLARARAAGVSRQIVPAIALDTFENLRALCAAEQGLYPAYGLHPMFLQRHRSEHLAELAQWIEREKPLAVGECGLDFHAPELDPEMQRTYFQRQLEMARDFALPVILHARHALDEVTAAIRRTGKLSGVVHSFSGSVEQAQQLWKLGFCLGIGGPVTYQRARRLRSIVATMPIDFLLLETDSPDQPLHGRQGVRNEPARLAEVCTCVAALRDADARASPTRRVETASACSACTASHDIGDRSALAHAPFVRYAALDRRDPDRARCADPGARRVARPAAATDRAGKQLRRNPLQQLSGYRTDTTRCAAGAIQPAGTSAPVRFL